MSLHPKWNLSLQYSLLLMVPFDLLASLGMDIYLPAIPNITDNFLASGNAVQLTLSLYMLMLGVGQLIFGPLSDRYGRRSILLGGNLLFILSSVGLTLAGNIETFISLRVLQGTGASAVLVATFATVRDAFGHRKESITIYALLGGMLAVVPAFGPMIGAMLITWLNWQAIFLSLAGIACISGIHAFFQWPETRSVSPQNRSISTFAIIASSSKFWLFTLAFSVAMGSFFVYFSIAPHILIRRLGYTPIEFSLLFSSVALIMIITSRFVGKVVESIGINSMLRVGMGCILSGALFLGLNGFNSIMSAAGFILPMVIVAVGISSTCAVSANGALSDFPDTAGTAVAFYYCLEALTVCLFGTLAVAIFPKGSVWPLVLFCGAGSTTILVGTLLVRHD